LLYAAVAALGRQTRAGRTAVDARQTKVARGTKYTTADQTAADMYLRYLLTLYSVDTAAGAIHLSV